MTTPSTSTAEVEALIRVHAGAEVARRVLVGGIEGPDAFKDSRVVVYLRDLLDALDGGSKKRGLLALGDTPEERIAKGRALAAERDALVAELTTLKEALKDHHPCPSRCGTGCHNCRGTGFSQSPCLVCAAALAPKKEEG